MKKIAIFLITLYQAFFPIRGHCRYYPTCSQYTKNMIREYGVIKGSWAGFLRILSCQPFAGMGVRS